MDVDAASPSDAGSEGTDGQPDASDLDAEPGRNHYQVHLQNSWISPPPPPPPLLTPLVSPTGASVMIVFLIVDLCMHAHLVPGGSLYVRLKRFAGGNEQHWARGFCGAAAINMS